MSSYLEARVRETVPDGTRVVPHSTPVVSFGRCLTARVATLGINPSKREFLHANGELLQGSDRRLSTTKSLGVDDLGAAPPASVDAVLNDCFSYFSRGTAYWQWFGRLEPVLKSLSASYLDGSGCHLDLVQWATDPVWKDLGRQVKRQLLQSDAKFLGQQLRNEQLEVLLVNGSGVLNELATAFERDLVIEEIAPIIEGHHQKVRIYRGELFNRVHVFGWSVNLQSSYGVQSPLFEEIIPDRARHSL